MQIDFHHAATYVLARLAGFAHPDAAVVAYAAQYVDDATNGGIVQFENGLLYRRIATAHRAIERSNWRNGVNLLSWLPFHFLPGNGGLGAAAPVAEGPERLVCRKDSPVARESLEACLRDAEAGAPYALHRLGITAHAYADTWAHDGFVGLVHPLNAVSDLRDLTSEAPLLDRFARAAGWCKRHLFPRSNVPGHALALSYPDQPFLAWSYRNGKENLVSRRNPALFLEAAEALFGLFTRFLQAEGLPSSRELTSTQRELLLRMLEGNRHPDAGVRHAAWLRAVEDGTFGFTERLEYVAKGPGSWKHLALGTTAARDRGDEVFAYDPAFLRSHWFLFHEAAKLHRTYVLETLLPRFGLAITRENVQAVRGIASV